MSSFGVHQPWMLGLLALALLPLWRQTPPGGRHPSFCLLPADPLSVWLDWTLRALGALAIVCLVGALAGIHLLAQPYQKLSRGAEIAIVLDRSRSMDQRLVPRDTQIDWRSSAHEKKGEVARRVLGDFVAARPDDHFAFVLFSTRPMPVSDFTSEHGVIQAAIAASQTGRGISETELGDALEAALRMFAERPFIGPRAVLLVSDGGAQLDPPGRKRLTDLIARTRVGLYWIYLRSFRSPGLEPEGLLSTTEESTVPEHLLHRFFQASGAVYHAYEAESPIAMQVAIDDIKRLEDRTIRYNEMRPVRDLDREFMAVAMAAMMILMIAGQWIRRGQVTA